MLPRAALAAMLLLSPGTPAGPDRFVGAGCIIKVGEGIVMVRDLWSQRWSLPGGSALAGEAAALTAARETFEETGLAVRPHNHIGAAANGFRIYACTPVAGELALDATGHLPLPASAHQELIEARLVDPRALARSAWRFPGQRRQVLAMVAATPALTELGVAEARAPTGLLADELRLTRWLQQEQSRWLLVVLTLAAQLGSTASLGVVLAWTWHRRGWRDAVEDGALLLVACLGACLLKHACALPRPWHLDPALMRNPGAGFGFPSGHALMVAILAGSLASRRGGARAWAAAALCAGLCGLGRVAMGSHFLHDVVGAFGLAGLVLGGHRALCAALPAGRISLRSWALLGSATATAAIATAAQPTVVAYAATLAGLGAGLCLWPPVAPPGGRWQARLGLTLGCGAALALLATAAEPVDGGFLACLSHQVVAHVLLGLALPGADALARRLWAPAAAGAAAATARGHGAAAPPPPGEAAAGLAGDAGAW